MNEHNAGWFVTLGIAVVLIGGLFMWMIGAHDLRIMAYALVAGLLVSLILASAALPIRAWRRRDATGEIHHYYHDGTRTIKETRVLDGRTIEAPKLYQLPSQAESMAFPELLRAAFQSGSLSRGAGDDAPVDAEITPLSPDSDGWNGKIG